MRILIGFLILACCFSCKNEKQDAPVFLSEDEIIQPMDSINFHDDYKPLLALKNSIYFKTNNLDSLYVMSDQIMPNSLVADFNGDHVDDITFVVRNLRNNNMGLIFFHSLTDFHIVGAGNVDSAFDNINYTKFEIDRSQIAYETVIDSITSDIIEPNKIELKNIALHMKEEEGTSGLLTWDGKKYIYIHTGD